MAVFEGHGRLMAGVILGLVLGKPIGIFSAAWLAVRFGMAAKPAAYSWRQLWGAGALAGIGFTMSLFIAGQAFSGASDYAAAKIAVFIASLLAGIAGVSILWPRRIDDESLVKMPHDVGSLPPSRFVLCPCAVFRIGTGR
jgi:NhaA family Na+:H+ antiporter